MAGLYTRIAAGMFFPLHEKLKKHDSVAMKKRLEKEQWLTHQQQVELQNTKLTAFFERICQQVPYYKKLFDQLNLTPQDIKSAKDLSKLPFLDKPTIRANEQGLKNTSTEWFKQFNTGGSSGEPLIFYLGKSRISHDVGSKWRATRWWDVDIGDKEIVLWGSPIELGRQDYVRLTRDALLRSKLLSAFNMSEAQMHEYLLEIDRFKPAMLFGYPSAIARLAEYGEKQGLKIDTKSIKVAFVTAEKMLDHQKQAIERYFGCPTANGYGSRDAGFIAHACPHGSLHICNEDIIVEIIGEDGNPVTEGETGEIVVTHLQTPEFPFVRYRTGDRGSCEVKKCGCGREGLILKNVDGRTTDFITTPEGNAIHGLGVIYIMRELPFVQQFKITQNSTTELLIEAVIEGELDATKTEGIITGMQKVVGNSMEITVEQVDKIPTEKNGKYRYIVNKTL